MVEHSKSSHFGDPERPVKRLWHRPAPNRPVGKRGKLARNDRPDSCRSACWAEAQQNVALGLVVLLLGRSARTFSSPYYRPAAHTILCCRLTPHLDSPRTGHPGHQTHGDCPRWRFSATHRMGEELASEKGRAQQAKRQWLLEGPNGWLKEELVFGRFSPRGPKRV